MENKPREWWIDETSKDVFPRGETRTFKGIHVIEFRAYEQLAKDHAELQVDMDKACFEVEQLIIERDEVAKLLDKEMKAHSDECDMHSETNRLLTVALSEARAEIDRLKEFGLTDDIKAERAKADSLRAELKKWKEIETFSGLSAMEIFGGVNKLKRGKYGAPVDWPGNKCDCADPVNLKIHDDLCDMLEAMAYNADDVCTASVGIWGAIKVCRDLWKTEADSFCKMAESHRAMLVKLLDDKMTWSAWSKVCEEARAALKDEK